MKTYPLESITVEAAMQKQFALIDEITKVFTGTEILTRGDLGVVKGLNQPTATAKVEQVLAAFFNAQKAMLVRGAGTNAICRALFASCEIGDTVLIHQAPIYPTTSTTFKSMGLKTVEADFNISGQISEKLAQHSEIKAVLIQFTRQKPDDSYDMETVINEIRAVNATIPIVTDDNYAALKVPKIGSELGASMSCFSTFKLLGPVGIGCIVGDAHYLDKLRAENYSGGMQVQGFEAIDVLRGLIYAPVSLAISATVTEKTAQQLNNKAVAGVKSCFIANAQSKVLIIELEEAIAPQVLIEAEKLGAAPHPIGAESQYEFVPMFYRVSGTFILSDPTLTQTMIRVNPMRSGTETILRILDTAIKMAKAK
ncbi:MAG: aminotransferase class V-fold PLP-dependent enzyme [Culicoidibacterales bacterium]